MVMPCRGRNLRLKNDETGFSLVELLMVVAISSIVIAIIANIYIAQSKRYATTDSIANIQQDLRGVLAILPMEIRLAGCDPTKSNVPGIITATRNSFRFTMDTKDNAIPRLNVSDGQVNGDEDIAYGFAGNGDSNGNGIVDNGAPTGVALLRWEGGLEVLLFNPWLMTWPTTSKLWSFVI